MNVKEEQDGRTDGRTEKRRERGTDVSGGRRKERRDGRRDPCSLCLASVPVLLGNHSSPGLMLDHVKSIPCAESLPIYRW